MTWFALAALLAGLAAPRTTRAAAATCTPTATWDAATWATFGRPAGPGDWVAGDGSYPVRLADGAVAWFFGDSLVHRRDGSDALVRNSVVVQRGTSLRTLAGGTDVAPASLVPPVRGGTWLWPGSGFTAGSVLYGFYEEFTGPAGGFSATDRRYVVKVDPVTGATGTPREVFPGRTSWGHATYRTPTYTYVFGNRELDGWTNVTYLARFPAGSDGRPASWWFWTGAGWSADRSRAVPLRGPDGGDLVAKVASAGVVCGRVNVLTVNPFGATVDRRVSSSTRPEGPYGARHVLYDLPTRDAGTSYLPRYLALGTGHALVAYSSGVDGLRSRPRYVDVRW